MNIRIYSYWGHGTNRNNIRGPFYSNIQIFKYSCSSLEEKEEEKEEEEGEELREEEDHHQTRIPQGIQAQTE